MRVLLLLSLTTSCSELFCENPCDATAPPVRGTAAEYLAPLGDGWTAGAPAPCESGHVLVVSAGGEGTPGDVLARLRPALADLPVNSSGFGFWCGVGGPVGPFVETDDWWAVARIAMRVGPLLEGGGEVGIVVRERLVACPQSACGD
jgi:hypothetical protein